MYKIKFLKYFFTFSFIAFIAGLQNFVITNDKATSLSKQSNLIVESISSNNADANSASFPFPNKKCKSKKGIVAKRFTTLLVQTASSSFVLLPFIITNPNGTLLNNIYFVSNYKFSLQSYLALHNLI